MFERFYPESRFGGFSDLDGTIRFYSRVNALLEPESVIIDYGCGRGAYGEDPAPFRRALRILKGKACRVIGLDVDPEAAGNPFIDEFHLLKGGAWPMPNESASLVIADHVLEHLEQPSELFVCARQALRPGGFLCLRTPNAWNYVALLSRMIPNRAHARILSKIKERSQEKDVFRTYYRCNTIPALRQSLRTHGFAGVVYGVEAEPTYLSFSTIAYTLGVLHQRLVPGFLRTTLFVFARRL